MTAKKKPTHHEMTKAELEKELSQVKHALEISEESRTRLAADYANLERRMATERDQIRHVASAALMEKLFPVYDNFYRAAAHAPKISLEDLPNLTEDDLKRIFNYFSGLKMIEKQMEEVLGEAGLKRIPTKGEHFDPQLHEAISYEESNLPAETVIDEVEAGWQLQDKVIKPAKVRVSKG